MGAPLVLVDDRGIFCPAGGFAIDPWEGPVDRAVLTHAHADHARLVMTRALVAAPGVGVARARLEGVHVESVVYGERVRLGDVIVSLHPSGHVLGSAQIRIEHVVTGEVTVVTGDHKLAPDPTTLPFEPVRAHVLVTEATFGLPLFRWDDNGAIFDDILQWWRAARHEGLFAECVEATGDLAEAAALVLPPPSTPRDIPLALLVTSRVLALRHLDADGQRAMVTGTWDELHDDERLVWNKLLTGAFRVGVSELLVLRALAEATGVDAATLKHRTMGDWEPRGDVFSAFVSREASSSTPDRPYPFCLAHPLAADPASLGPREEWQVEWKWDGIRCQLVRRDDVFLWSRGEELVTSQFPEVAASAARLPAGTVLDGELLPWRGGVLPFAELQRRLNRKKIDRTLLEEVPIALVAHDVLEHDGVDVRRHPLVERRRMLEDAVRALDDERVVLLPVVDAATWEELARVREESRARHVEGFMLKRRSSSYGVGRKRGDWWKWKVDPYSIDAVLVYAQHGSGKRASLFTDYTFAVWNDDVEHPALVPFAKAYSGLTDEEIREVDAFVRKNTVEKFGPVRHVKEALVFEVGCEGIALSNRHKSGVAVRFPRMLRFRRDKGPEDADSVTSLRELLPRRQA
jgi:DNA ligase-1